MTLVVNPWTTECYMQSNVSSTQLSVLEVTFLGVAWMQRLFKSIAFPVTASPQAGLTVYKRVRHSARFYLKFRGPKVTELKYPCLLLSTVPKRLNYTKCGECSNSLYKWPRKSLLFLVLHPDHCTASQNTNVLKRDGWIFVLVFCSYPKCYSWVSGQVRVKGWWC